MFFGHPHRPTRYKEMIACLCHAFKNSISIAYPVNILLNQRLALGPTERFYRVVYGVGRQAKQLSFQKHLQVLRATKQIRVGAEFKHNGQKNTLCLVFSDPRSTLPSVFKSRRHACMLWMGYLLWVILKILLSVGYEDHFDAEERCMPSLVNVTTCPPHLVAVVARI